jgi:hypothetical protein
LPPACHEPRALGIVRCLGILASRADVQNGAVRFGATLHVVVSEADEPPVGGTTLNMCLASLGTAILAFEM